MVIHLSRFVKKNVGMYIFYKNYVNYVWVFMHKWSGTYKKNVGFNLVELWIFNGHILVKL